MSTVGSEKPRAERKYEFTPEGCARNTTSPEPTTYKNHRLSRRISRTTLVLIVVIVLLLVALVIVAVFLGIANNAKSAPKPAANNTDVCMTEECIAEAARINSYINKSASPCNDFYQFACGGWMDKNVIPDNSLGLDSVSSALSQKTIAIKNMLEAEDKYQDSRSFNQARLFYRSCMFQRENTQKIKDFKTFLDKELNGWPLINTQWSETNFNLMETLSKLTIYGSSHLFSLQVTVDQKNLSKSVFELSEPWVYQSANISENVKHKDFIKKLVAVLEPDIGSVSGAVEELVNFGSKLQAIINESRVAQNENWLQNNALTKEDLQNSYRTTVFDWNQYFDILMRLSKLPTLDKKDRIIVVKSPSYFSKLADLLQSSNKKVVANYVIWNFIDSYAHMLGGRIEYLVMEELKDIYKVTAKSDRYVYCVYKTYLAVGLSVHQMYVKNFFNLSSTNAAQNVTSDVKHAITVLLNGTDWMEDNLKKYLIEKNQQMSFIFPELISVSDVDNYYSNLNFDEKNFFANIITAKSENTKRQFSLLKAEVDKKQLKLIRFYSQPSVYNLFENQLTLRSSLLQPPFISNNWPMYLNYGVLGSELGVDLMYNFDITGKFVNKQGSLDLIRKQAKQWVFDERSKCFKSQFEKFTDQTKGQKMVFNDYVKAESGGIKVAFMAYTKWQAKYGKLEQLLPSVQFDQNQLFFLSFAQMKCRKNREFNAVFGKSGQRSVVYPLQNSPEFAKAFSCPADSYMNPITKCAIW